MRRVSLRGLVRAVRAQLFSVIDYFVPKSKQTWVFPVYFLGKGALCDNMLAVLRALDPSIRVRCFILSRNAHVLVEDERWEVVPMSSYRAVWILMRSGVIFAQHSIWLDLAKAKFRPGYLTRRTIVNLWHGIPIKDLSHSNTGIHMRKGLREMPHYIMPCSSELDRKAMMKGFGATPTENFWVTGIPRNDFLSCEEAKLPGAYKAQLTDLRAELEEKCLVLYTPTYRETPAGGKYFEFGQSQLARLKDILSANNAVLGVRFHSYRPPDNQAALLSLDEVVDASGTRFDDVRLLVREAGCVITDYSSIGLDALYAGTPLLSFAYDLEHYEFEQRGFFYDLQEIFGEGIARNFEQLATMLDTVLSGRELNSPGVQSEVGRFESKIFRFRDDRNGQRLAERLVDRISRKNKI